MKNTFTTFIEKACDISETESGSSNNHKSTLKGPINQDSKADDKTVGRYLSKFVEDKGLAKRFKFAEKYTRSAYIYVPTRKARVIYKFVQGDSSKPQEETLDWYPTQGTLSLEGSIREAIEVGEQTDETEIDIDDIDELEEDKQQKLGDLSEKAQEAIIKRIKDTLCTVLSTSSSIFTGMKNRLADELDKCAWGDCQKEYDEMHHEQIRSVSRQLAGMYMERNKSDITVDGDNDARCKVENLLAIIGIMLNSGVSLTGYCREHHDKIEDDPYDTDFAVEFEHDEENSQQTVMDSGDENTLVYSNTDDSQLEDSGETEDTQEQDDGISTEAIRLSNMKIQNKWTSIMKNGGVTNLCIDRDKILHHQGEIDETFPELSPSGIKQGDNTQIELIKKLTKHIRIVERMRPDEYSDVDNKDMTETEYQLAVAEWASLLRCMDCFARHINSICDEYIHWIEQPRVV